VDVERDDIRRRTAVLGFGGDWEGELGRGKGVHGLAVIARAVTE
jgi:hypothetical protein